VSSTSNDCDATAKLQRRYGDPAPPRIEHESFVNSIRKDCFQVKSNLLTVDNLVFHNFLIKALALNALLAFY